ncbi:Glu/Leu/Phe/Val dehydrogenase [Candidatus Saccharibacteria bacterium]|nr:Glu/Leu/Phe/Val dehydrogenase [Candidatus Saccharibacteria bacterium]
MLTTSRQLGRKRSKSFRILKEFDDHEMVIGISDAKSGLRGYIAIHNTNLGPALGGTRWQRYPSEEAAIRDVLNLSKAMSYKCAIAGLPWGGGKAVIFAEEDADREAQLKAYAKKVEKLKGLFKTGTDLGIFDSDVRKMARHTKHMLGVSKADRGDLTTSKMAALGVYYCIKAALDFAHGSESVKGRTIGIKGVGKLGGELVELLSEDGANLVIADVDADKCQRITQRYPGVKVVEPKEIHKQRLDVYSPCALGNELSGRIIKELKTKIIAGGANNQLANEFVGDRLFEKGILYAPDYVTNAGGLIYVADELETDGFHKERVLQRVKDLQVLLKHILTASKKQNIPAHKVANGIGLERILTGKAVNNGH